MRKLLYVPLLHSPAALEADGRTSHLTQETSRFWQILDAAVKERDLDKPILYLEGSTTRKVIGPGELNTLNELMPEQNVIRALLKYGGVIEETEDQELLTRAKLGYERLDEVVKQSQIDPSLAFLSEEDKNLIAEIPNISDARSQAVAQRIIKTLPEGRIGVLMLGGNHDVLGKLPDDIDVEILDPRLDEIISELKRDIKRESEVPKEFSGGGEAKG